MIKQILSIKEQKKNSPIGTIKLIKEVKSNGTR